MACGRVQCWYFWFVLLPLIAASLHALRVWRDQPRDACAALGVYGRRHPFYARSILATVDAGSGGGDVGAGPTATTTPVASYVDGVATMVSDDAAASADASASPSSSAADDAVAVDRALWLRIIDTGGRIADDDTLPRNLSRTGVRTLYNCLLDESLGFLQHFRDKHADVLDVGDRTCRIARDVMTYRTNAKRYVRARGSSVDQWLLQWRDVWVYGWHGVTFDALRRKYGGSRGGGGGGGGGGVGSGGDGSVGIVGGVFESLFGADDYGDDDGGTTVIAVVATRALAFLSRVSSLVFGVGIPGYAGDGVSRDTVACQRIIDASTRTNEYYNSYYYMLPGIRGLTM